MCTRKIHFIPVSSLALKHGYPGLLAPFPPHRLIIKLRDFRINYKGPHRPAGFFPAALAICQAVWGAQGHSDVQFTWVFSQGSNFG
jgi:hypothetical protein